jgi:hypothetical protein
MLCLTSNLNLQHHTTPLYSTSTFSSTYFVFPKVICFYFLFKYVCLFVSFVWCVNAIGLWIWCKQRKVKMYGSRGEWRNVYHLNYVKWRPKDVDWKLYLLWQKYVICFWIYMQLSLNIFEKTISMSSFVYAILCTHH